MPGIHAVGSNIIERDGEFLLVQETLEHVKGKWNLPAGKLDEKESIIECAAREGEEETGFKLKPEYIVGIYQHQLTLKANVILFVFKSKIIGGELIKPNHEIMGLKWLSFDEVKKMSDEGKLRNPYIWAAINDYKAGKSLPLEIITVLD